MIVRERGGRPEWVPILFIPAMNLEAIFFEKTHAAVALAIDQGRMHPIGKERIVMRQDLVDEAGLESALLAFFEQAHDVTSFRAAGRVVRLPARQAKRLNVAGRTASFQGPLRYSHTSAGRAARTRRPHFGAIASERLARLDRDELKQVLRRSATAPSVEEAIAIPAGTNLGR